MLPVMEYVRLAVLAVAIVGTAIVTHKVDQGTIEHLKAEHILAQKQALEWGMSKQKEYDDAALKSAEHYADAERDRANGYEHRLAELSRIPASVLVRGCLTYEFVRTLDAAISNRAVQSLPLPAGKSNDACAPVDAAVVARWLVGLIDTGQHNASQLTQLQAFIRQAQRLR